MVIFEDWIENSFSKINHQSESAINLAQLYWQGSDTTFHQNDNKKFSKKIY